jgi:hypothetical protein
MLHLLHDTCYGCSVTAVTTNNDGVTAAVACTVLLQAERLLAQSPAASVLIGSEVIGVGSTDVSQHTHAGVVSLLRKAPRPVKITFRYNVNITPV